MRVFLAGGTGVLGRRLVPQLVARGHQVTATTTSAAKLRELARQGADGVVMDGWTRCRSARRWPRLGRR
ncbi:NAD(P)H-binding protein [Embleya sp. NPDC127516]|uniref:NAD(P)H-binding protein n=1 Tax=Embleya sp. NPDC127516 TaxID=3363990 RepID=UPI003824A070